MKSDGTFTFSSGATDSGFGTIKFTKNAYSIDDITYSKSNYDANNNHTVYYFVNGNSATEDEYMVAMKEQYEKPSSKWYDFIDSNIENILK